MSEPEAIIVAAVVAVVGTFVGAVALVFVQFLAARESRQSRADGRLESQRARAQQALEWMTGETQRRNVGIAAIEASLAQSQDGQFQDLVIPVLCGSATYLLCESGQSEKAHELYNLDRIMALLMTKADAKQRERFRDGYISVFQALGDNAKCAQLGVEERRKLNHSGLFVDAAKVEGWQKQLKDWGIGQGSFTFACHAVRGRAQSSA